MKHFLAFTAMTSLIVSPLSASVRDAAFASSADPSTAQTSVFAGATYKVGLDRRSGEPRGRASLKLAGMVKPSAYGQARFSDGLEIASGRTGKPALHLAGRDVGELNQKANLGTVGTAAIVVVEVAVAAAVVVALLIDERLDRQNQE